MIPRVSCLSLVALALASCEPAIYIGSGSSCATPVVAEQVMVAEQHGCALSSGHVLCWGNGLSGQLGNADTVSHSSPVAVESFDTFDDVAVSSYGSCARRTDSTLFCWGDNFGGGLADGTSQNSATVVETIGGVANVSMGPGYVLTRAAGGSLTVWGGNELGQLGLGPASVGTAVRTETPVVGSSFASISAGEHHACALDTSGHAFCSGANEFGQFAMPPSPGSDVFTSLTVALAFRSIEAGYDRTCGITTAGALYCWGRNDTKWLPSNQGVVAMPAPIGTDTDFTQVSLGFSHACALRDGGRLFCWGSNDDDELGYHGAASDTPKEVTPGTTYSSVTSGWGYNCALRRGDSVVVCWGRNDGRLGRGADASRNPKPVCMP